MWHSTVGPDTLSRPLHLLSQLWIKGICAILWIGLCPSILHAQPLTTTSQSYSGSPQQYPGPLPSYSGPVVPAIPTWGDPYQMVAPPTVELFPSSVMPSAGLFGGLFNRNKAPAAPPSAVQLSQPMVIEEPMPIVGSPMIQGGAVYNSMSEYDPLLPQSQNVGTSRFYGGLDLLFWSVSGMDAPALVTTSPPGTPREQAAVLGEPGTSVLFGDGSINKGTVGGVRLYGGLWMSPSQNISFENEFFQLATKSDGYNGSSDGSVILGRPFFDIVAGQETAQLVSYPGLVSGTVLVNTSSELRSFLLNSRLSVNPQNGNCCQTCGMRDRNDLIFGYRYIRLADSMGTNEHLVSQIPEAPGTIDVFDQFDTRNQIHALQLGYINRAVYKRVWLDSSMRVAVGNNKQSLRINGGTTYNENGVIDTYNGGVLAHSTNIGTYERSDFVMVPELGLKMGTRLGKRFRCTFGYSVLYIPQVLRATEQIDTDVNPNLIQEEIAPVTGALRPRVIFVHSDYIAHGLSFGGELHF